MLFDLAGAAQSAARAVVCHHPVVVSFGLAVVVRRHAQQPGTTVSLKNPESHVQLAESHRPMFLVQIRGEVVVPALVLPQLSHPCCSQAE